MPSEAAVALDEGGRRLHPLTLGFSAITIARQMVWPALVGGFGLGDGQIARMLPIFAAALAVPALIGATLTYTLYRWRLTGDELLLRSGVLSRRNRVIPLARVQNVEVRQNVLHRVLGVAELRVETAGAGTEAEAVLSVLGLAEAQAARVRLLAHRRASAPAAVDGEAADTVERPAAPPLARLSTGDVLRAGATANEAGVIAAALAGLLQFADDLPLPFFEQVGDAVMGRAAESWLAFGIGLVILFLVLGWLISIAGAVVRYHGFTLAVEGGEMRKRYGLLTVHEASVPLERVQAIRVEESLPRRLLGLASLSIETAGGTPGQRGGAEAFVPIARRAEVGRLVRGIFGDADADTPLQPVHPAARRRLAFGYLVRLLIVWAPFWVARWLDVQPAGMLAPWMALLLPLPWLAAGWAYRARGWALPPGYVMARSGVLTRVTWIVPDRKLQTLHLRATPFQRRRGLATVVVDTAAGGRQAAIIDLGEPTARRLLHELTARIRAATQLRAAERIAREAEEAVARADAEQAVPMDAVSAAEGDAEPALASGSSSSVEVDVEAAVAMDPPSPVDVDLPAVAVDASSPVQAEGAQAGSAAGSVTAGPASTG
ncbi:MAG TPA: PH domain-containing protein [Longimicrobium sp.]|nr:PH domain-containing protein [Longimicrobium sp.]